MTEKYPEVMDKLQISKPTNTRHMRRICRAYAHEHPEILFIFGDNDDRQGLGGLAKELRGLPNAIGVRVKKHPKLDSTAFYKDQEYPDNITKIEQDFQNIRANWHLYDSVVFPKAGLGTGLAQLKERAPETYNYLVKIARNHGFEQPE